MMQTYVRTMGGDWRDDFEFAHRAPSPSPSLWLAYVKLDEPPGLSPVTTVGRFATAEEALLATDAIRTSR